MTNKAIIIFIWLFLLSDIVVSQNISQWPYQHIDKRAGLSNSAITSIYMDKNDYIWFGTWDGLNRYDGSTISVYKPNPANRISISNNIVRELHEDGKGRLWIITHSGINQFNPDLNSFSSWFDTLNVPFQEYSLKACIGPDSAVWIGLVGWGIGQFSEKSGNFIPYEINGIDPEWPKTVSGIGSYNGLLYILSGTGKLACVKDHRIISSHRVNLKSSIQQPRFLILGDRYFLAVPAENGSLDMYDLMADSIVPVRLKMGTTGISSISQNQDKNALWVGTESGNIFKITLANGHLKNESFDSHIPLLSQKKLKILSITETSQNIMWIGTDGDGIYKFLTKERLFNSITYGQTDQGHLSQSIVRCIYEDAGKLYVGTRGGGLNILNTENQTENRVYTTKDGLSNNAVLSINKDQKGNLWIGVDGEGIDMMEAKTRKIFHFPRDVESSGHVNFASVYAICIGADNSIWLGTSGFGVIHLQILKHADGRYFLGKYEKIDSRNSKLKSNIVYSIIEETPGVFWFGTRFGGLYKYNSGSREFEEIVQATGSPSGLSNNDVLSLCRDSKNHLWIGTSGGLNYKSLESSTRPVVHYSQSDGLLNNTIHGILEDDMGRIWISTNEGLSLFNYNDRTFKNFDWNDGLQNNEFTDGAVFKSPVSHKLYFGGIDGVDIVNPDKLDTSFFFPKLAFTEFQVHNVIINPGDNTGLISRNINSTENIRLNYNQNFITFHFTTLDYWNKQRCKYAYYLENYDKEWIYINKQSFVNLVNVPPGRYKLHIKYTNENGSWNSETRTVSIIITPPFWATKFAFAVYALMFILVQAAWINAIRKRIRRKKIIAIEKIKREHEEELNNYKLQFFTNIAHEFRTPLTLIMGPVATILKKNNDYSIKKYLTTVYKNALRLQKLIQELIEFRRIETGNAKLEVADKNLNDFTADIVGIFQEYAFERDIELSFIPFEGPSVGYIDSKKIEKVLINLISNSIKYTQAGGTITVRLIILNQVASFEIADTGIGISPEIIEKIFDPFFHGSENYAEVNGITKGTGIGLSLTKSLVEVHKGRIYVESIARKGSKFTFTIPVAANDYEIIVSQDEQLIVRTQLKEKINTEFESSEYGSPDTIATSDTGMVSGSEKENHLLIVDDNPQVLSMLADILNDKYGVHQANTGIKALEVLDNHKIDLVISDVIMPDMDGLMLCQKIKENIETSHLPVILLTAKGEIEQRIEGLQAGADSYIPKPFHPDHLFVRIEKLLQSREVIRKKFSSLALYADEKITQGLGKSDEDFLEKLSGFIMREMGNSDLGAEHLESFMGMSKTSLYKKIKSLTGLSPHLLINQYRLKRAAYLLRNGEMNVSEVIYETGFNSRSYFYRSFSQLFHCSPKDYSKIASN
jgi:signal transduction histidine kinase/ligand-binding sensor domain-containing protein/DNA-binding NarL/FixJ family response regulator